MAWNTQTAMSQRTQMIVDFESGGYSKAALARRYGVSRQNLYKWIGRYELESFEGLKDRSRAPLHQAHAVEEGIEQELLRMKTRWPLWGAPKLHFKLKELVGEERCPSESTVSNILRRHGLTKGKKRRRVIHQATAATYGQQPNDVWCADFKGWFMLGNGGRCDPLTITDAASRYLIRCQGLCGKTSTEMVQPIFTAAFREHGLPRAIRTDNGAPFASQGLAGLSRLSVWWLKHGIELERIEPGHPEQNGRHERMHRTLKEAITPAAYSLRTQQRAFEEFREHYNHERPHEALGFAVPGARYEPSARQWSEKLPAAP
jgi:putative transposase